MKDENVEVREAYAKEREHRLADLRDVMELPAGRRYLWWLMGRTHMFSSTHTGNSNGAFLEGERNIGLMIFKDLSQINPDLLVEMARSHAEMLRKIEEGRKTDGSR